MAAEEEDIQEAETSITGERLNQETVLKALL